MFYSSTIFTKMKISARLGSGLVGFINMISTFGALFLLGSKFCNFIVLEFGRKTLLWTLSFVMAADLIGLGIAFLYVDD